MAAFTEDDIINAVTFAIGSPSESEYPLAAKQDALRRALTHYSQYRPLRKIGKFTTVVDQQQYDIASSYSYLVSVREVFWGSVDQDFSDVYSNIPQTTNYDGMDLASNEALRVIRDQNVSVVEASSRFETKMIDDVTVALIPTPEDETDVYFSYTLIKSVADLKEREYQDIVDFTFIISAIDLANKRHKILQVNEPASGYVMFQSGLFFYNQAQETRKRLMNSLGVNSLVLHG